MFRSLRPFAIIIGIVLCLTGLTLVPNASADTSGYGPWYQQPSSSTTLKNYDGTVLPFESQTQAEITNFTCTFPDGTPLTPAQINELAGILADASAVSNGSLKDGNGQSSGYSATPGGMDAYLSDVKTLLDAGKYTRFSDYTGSEGPDYVIGSRHTFQPAQYLGKASSQITSLTQDENTRQATLTTQINQVIAGMDAANHTGQAPLSVQAIENLLANYGPPPKGTPANMVKHTWSEMESSYHQIQKDKAEIASLSSTATADSAGLGVLLNTSAANVVDLYNNIPQGCGFDPIQQDNLKFIDVITNTGTFFQDLILYLPSKAASGAYQFLQPYAFLYTFWTPHTERGDTLFNVTSSCQPISGGTAAQTAAQNIAIQDQCDGTIPLGYTNPGTAGFDTKKAPWYIDMALFMEWLISGFYFVILFSAAVLYMVRGNKNTHLHVLQLIPKLVASALLTVLAPYIMGELITFSNDLVTALFSFKTSSGTDHTVGEITVIIDQTTTYLSGAGSFFSQLVQIVIGLWVSVYFAMFIIGSLIRQVFLIGFIIFAPVACFCFLSPRWQHHFSRYWRGLVAVIFTPPAMALVLKVGITINPIISASGNIGTFTGVIGLLLMVATLWAVNKTMRIGYAVARNNPAAVGGMAGKALGQVGSMASLAAASGVAGPWGTAALRAGGALASGAGRMSQAGDGMAAKLVPQGMMLGAGGAGPKGSLKGPGGAKALPGIGGTSFGGAGGKMVDGLNKRFSDWTEVKEGQQGGRRMSAQMVAAYKRTEETELAKHMSGRQAALDRPMSSKEIRIAKDEFYNGKIAREGDAPDGKIILGEDGAPKRLDRGWYADHGTVVRRGGSYHLRKEIPQSDNVPSMARARSREAVQLAGRVGGKLTDVAVSTHTGQGALYAADRARSAAQGAARTAGSAAMDAGVRKAAVNVAVAADAVRHSPTGEKAAQAAAAVANLPDRAANANRQRKWGDTVREAPAPVPPAGGEPTPQPTPTPTPTPTATPAPASAPAPATTPATTPAPPQDEAPPKRRRQSVSQHEFSDR